MNGGSHDATPFPCGSLVRVLPPALSVGPPRERLLATASAVVLLTAAFLGSDLPGRVLTGPVRRAAVAVLARDVLLRPVLSADGAGLTVVSGVRRVQVPWGEVERLRVVTDRRTPMLEVDLGETVLVVPRGRLDQPLDEVLDGLRALRSAR